MKTERNLSWPGKDWERSLWKYLYALETPSMQLEDEMGCIIEVKGIDS